MDTPGPRRPAWEVVRPRELAQGRVEIAWLRDERPSGRVRADARASVRLQARAIGSAEQRERPEAGEGVGQLGRPAPAVLKAQGDLARATGDAARHVQDHVAQPPPLCGGQLAAEDQALGEG